MAPTLAAGGGSRGQRTAEPRALREGGGWAAVAGRSGPTPPAARGWAELPEAEKRSRTSRLSEMGFPLEDARQALEEHGWDPNRALDGLVLGACRPKSGAQAGAKAAEPADPPAAPLALEAGSKTAAEAGIKRMLGLQPKPQPGGGASPDRSTAASECTPSPRTPPMQAVSPQAAAPPAAQAAPPVPATPNRRLVRVRQAWKQEEWCSASQLNVEEGDLVLVWDGSGTAMGWVYAESVKEGGGSGWLPLSTVGEDTQQQQQPPLPPSAPAPEAPAMVPYAAPMMPPPPVQPQPPARWMRTNQACAATYDNQLPVQAGAPLLVHTDRVSPDGHWVFAEALDAGARSCPGVGVGPAAASRAGWVPRVCVEWPGSR